MNFHLIAEKRILEAMEKGEFDNLNGMGKPLVKDEIDRLPEELRMGYNVLKNSGFIDARPENVTDMTTLEPLMNSESEKKELKTRKKFRYMKKKSNLNLDDPTYKKKIMKKIEN